MHEIRGTTVFEDHSVSKETIMHLPLLGLRVKALKPIKNIDCLDFTGWAKSRIHIARPIYTVNYTIKLH